MVDNSKDKVKQAIMAQCRGILTAENLSTAELKVKISQVVKIIIERDYNTLAAREIEAIIAEITDEFTGFGPIESLLRDNSVAEIMINGYKKIYAEKTGKMQFTGVSFEDEAHLMYFVNKMLEPTRHHVDESFPYTEFSLSDGSRVNVIIPPLALDGPIVTIRKFSKNIKTIDDLFDLDTLDKRMSDFLVAAIRAKANIIFSGSSGVGKTTTLNVLSRYITDNERIITIEDTAELRLAQEHVVRLEARQPNIEGKGEISIRDLFKNSLRMRPDRIILGEIRGSEALDMLQAICSGHQGALAVLHANSPQEVIYRLETMILTSGVPISIEAIHRQIAISIDLIIHQEQLLDGSRKIIHITQVNGLKDGQVVLEDIFRYELDSYTADSQAQGRWIATGVIPEIYGNFQKIGISLSKETFS